MHKFIKNGIDFSKWVIVTKVSYPLFAIQNKYLERAEAIENYVGNFKTSKLISVTMMLKENCKSFVELQHDLEKFIIQKLYTNNPEWINIDDRYTKVVLEDIEDEEMYKGIVTVIYKSLNSNWYSEEKEKNVIGQLNNLSLEKTNEFIIEINPNNSNVKIKHTESGKSITIIPKSINHKIIVDFSKKIVMQNDAHAPISIDSDFFKLIPGNNTISITGASGIIKYREVLG